MRQRADLVDAAAVIGVLVLAAFLRLHALELVEFKLDEATAVDRAHRLLDGHWPTVGLQSSVGALNPPFFVYLLAIPLGLRDDPLAATAFVGVLAVVAVGLTYVVLRPRFGMLAALAAAAFFAAAPWAVLYGRKIWAQDVLPIVDVLLLWCLFVVLERRRSRAVVVVPVLACLAFQLNFSALALLVPIAVALGYRAREVDWLWFGIGAGLGALLLGPWLAHEAAHGFTDVGRLLSEGRGNRGPAPVGSGTAGAIRQTVDVTGAWNWGYVVGASRRALAADAGWAWTYGRWASALVAGLLVLGLYTCAIRIGAGADRRRGWPWFGLDVAARRRALLLVWLGGVWLSYLTSAKDNIFPHYLIVTYPVSFAVAAIGLADVVGLLRRRLRFATLVGVGVTAAVVAGYTGFVVAFLGFLDREGGVSGDYGVVYRDEKSVARLLKQRGLHVDQPALELLASGTLSPPPEARLALVRNTLVDEPPFPCSGDRRSVGPLVLCLPRRQQRRLSP